MTKAELEEMVKKLESEVKMFRAWDRQRIRLTSGGMRY